MYAFLTNAFGTFPQICKYSSKLSQFSVVLTFNLIVVFGINFCLWIDVGFLLYFPANAHLIVPGPSIK